MLVHVARMEGVVALGNFAARRSRSFDYRHAAGALLGDQAEVRVLAAMSPQLPEKLVAALIVTARQRRVRVTLFTADLTGRWRFVDPSAMQDIASGQLRLVSLAGAIPSRLCGAVDHFPQSLWEIDQLIASGTMKIDIFVARVPTVPDSHAASFGDMVGFSASALTSGARVGLELLPDVAPYPGTDEIQLADANAIVFCSSDSSPVPSEGRTTTLSTRITEYLGSLIPNGATLQLGLGAVPLSVIPALAEKTRLGLHSGILPSELLPIIGSGAIDGLRKSRDLGVHMATGVLGGLPAEWGSAVRLRPISYTHNPKVLQDFENFWAINSAFEVDLTGSANAEFVEGLKIASAGGQLDFVRAAHASRGGGSVIALSSRARNGRPRIRHTLPSGHHATTLGNDIDFVVTEYGIADLRGRSAQDRATQLISIAHPDDRRALSHATSG